MPNRAQKRAEKKAPIKITTDTSNNKQFFYRAEVGKDRTGAVRVVTLDFTLNLDKPVELRTYVDMLRQAADDVEKHL